MKARKNKDRRKNKAAKRTRRDKQLVSTAVVELVLRERFAVRILIEGTHLRATLLGTVPGWRTTRLDGTCPRHETLSHRSVTTMKNASNAAARDVPWSHRDSERSVFR